METTEMLQLLGAECDQEEEVMKRRKRFFLSRWKVLPPLVQTGDGNATTS